MNAIIEKEKKVMKLIKELKKVKKDNEDNAVMDKNENISKLIKEGFSKENASLSGIVEKLGGEVRLSLIPGKTICLIAVLPGDNWPIVSG